MKMEHILGNSKRLKAVNYFHKNTTSYMFGRVLNTFLTLFIFHFITLCMKGLTNPTPPTQQALTCSRSTMLSKHSSWWRSVEDVVKTAWRSVQSNKFSSSKLPWRSLQKPLEDEQLLHFTMTKTSNHSVISL